MAHIVQVADTVVQLLSDLFSRSIQTAFPEINPVAFVEVTKSTQSSFGHYQLNSAMKLAKECKSNPRKVAEAIVSHMPECSDIIEKLEIAGPGFINIWLNVEFLQKRVRDLIDLEHLGVKAPRKEKIIIDFSSPNTAKEMHVGHLRSTIIGDCLARTFEFLGHEVVRVNHIGDWGTSFGMLIAYIKEFHKESVTLKEELTLTDLVAFYKAAKKLFDEDAAFKKRSQEEVVRLQSGEKEAVVLWEAICDISRRAYQEVYDLLDVRLIERGESFYNKWLSEVVQDLEDKGLVTVSEGAKCIYLEGFFNREGEPLPLMVQKSDGGYNYDTTDMAAIRHRIQDEKGDRLIYVTDAGQANHFAMIFQAAIKAGYLDPAKVRTDHVPFGLVLGPDGKKFRSRSGDTERLMDLLETAIVRALAILKERNPDWSEEDCNTVAKALGINAVKYSDLVCHRISDYSFSYDKMLRFEGNTAAFVMYSYVRVLGIQRKVGVDVEKILANTSLELEHLSEIALGLHLARFAEVIASVADELLPNRLTEYLYELAELFNAFFRDCRVEGSEQQNSRLILVEATRKVLQQGITLLGLSTVGKM